MNKSDKIVVVGAGATGQSVVNFLSTKVDDILLVDEKMSAEKLSRIKKKNNSIKIANEITSDILEAANYIILSPGVSPHKDVFQVHQEKLIGDIEVFARYCSKPIIGITGTNGKSTVVTLLGDIFIKAGISVGIGGNLGTPALDLLAQDYSVYILELSSFQLELTNSLQLEIGCILNITPDHLDRHANFSEYIKIKQKIFTFSKKLITNRHDANTIDVNSENTLSFGLTKPQHINEFGINEDGKYLGAYNNDLVKISDLQIIGEHNYLNVLATLSICSLYNIKDTVIKDVIYGFAGLPYRMQIVSQAKKALWINDSKSTNVGSLIASVQGLLKLKRKIILLMGGDAKKQNFSALSGDILDAVKIIIIYGRDKESILNDLQYENIMLENDLSAAVKTAFVHVSENELVLLSPGCASFDMFPNYIARGLEFNKIVNAL